VVDDLVVELDDDLGHFISPVPLSTAKNNSN